MHNIYIQFNFFLIIVPKVLEKFQGAELVKISYYFGEKKKI